MRTLRWNTLGGALVVAALTCVQSGRTAPESSNIERLQQLEPGIVAFVARCDDDVVKRGRGLTDAEAALAREVGVAHPERVRILVAPDFPEPDDPQLAQFLDRLGPAHPVAETTGYGIQLTLRVATSRRILLHELTHVGQIERLGAEGFWHAYLVELVTVGYWHSTFEEEARDNEHR